MSTVSCVNRTVQEISRKLEFLNDESFTVIPLIHGTGCGLVVESEDHINLQRLIKGYSLNNNTFEFILIGLGWTTSSRSNLKIGLIILMCKNMANLL